MFVKGRGEDNGGSSKKITVGGRVIVLKLGESGSGEKTPTRRSFKSRGKYLSVSGMVNVTSARASSKGGATTPDGMGLLIVNKRFAKRERDMGKPTRSREGPEKTHTRTTAPDCTPE